MNNSLFHYQAIEQTGVKMVSAAHQGDWAEVTRLEALANQQFQALRYANMPATVSPYEREARHKVLKVLLRLDAEVRRLAEPGWVLTDEWLGSSPPCTIDERSEDGEATF